MSSSISASDARRYSRAALSAGAWRGLAVMALAAVAVFALYALIFVYQFGSGSRAEWWLRDIMHLRHVFYTEAMKDIPVEDDKSLIVGGSAALFGVDGARIAAQTGQPAFNLGLHAGLDIDLLLAPAIQYVDAGDRVIVPLEFELYTRDKPTALTPTNFIAFLYPYAGLMPLRDQVDILVASSPVEVLEAARRKLSAKLFGGKAPLVRDDAALIADWQKVRADPDLPGYGPYDYSTMTAHGDKDLALNTPRETLAGLADKATPAASGVSPYAERQLVHWRNVVADAGGTMVMTWPVIIEDDRGSVFSEEYWAQLIALARATAAIGLPLHCDPIAALVPRQYRFDTVYHLNIKGAALYSDGLAACLAKPEAPLFDFEKADPAELARRARARIEALRTPQPPLYFAYERNLARLAALDAAIGDIRKRDGAYPAALPTGTDAAGVWYRSDGADFKLLIEDPKECYIAALAAPARIDPVRRKDGDCSAYGYWSEGAADW